jgi:hypothetical protein
MLGLIRSRFPTDSSFATIFRHYSLFSGPFVMACKDLSDECGSYATEGGCDDFAPLSSIGEIKTMCKKSCGFCGS